MILCWPLMVDMMAWIAGVCLIPEMAKLLSARGQIFVEIGDGQGADVIGICHCRWIV